MSSSSKSIKFEISLKELKVSFEGDIQTAERMQSQITGAINSLASAQQKLIGSGATQQATPPVVEAAPRRRGGRRRRTGTTGIDPAIIDGTTVAQHVEAEPNGNGNGAARRTPTGQQTALISTLKTEGYFGEKRTIGDIRDQLATKGHTFKSNEISPSLVALTKAGTLKRMKDQGLKQWVYYTE